MNRHYYISDDLDELEQVEQELEASGISTEQIHVLSEKDADMDQHRLHSVSPFMKTDVVNSGRRGIYVGLVLAAAVLLVAYFSGWTQTVAGWVPFVFLALVLLGFSAWEGGFFGIQEPNGYFRRFQELLREGKHVFFVDVEPPQEPVLEQVIRHHPHLQVAGTGAAMPHWVMSGQQKLHRFRKMI
ncbi:NAD/FAD-utilizing enzyme apparently involved in cell division [Pseudomonas indica]|uniref:NAD/FAD-utilizing enzyme apparently involved in cell division n=1 Tax=Pseudomonas indica TaxID=137658 RepID=A0A1G9GXY5_9PSED|nr:NAD/FAD-utilizing enzyme apparently involved in cell division [Pseudomonas indica]MBU3056788.1 magnesium transporter [Pseudomonas indica]PAU60159.1 NAD/FAD-utilizing enzyme apparently involved in cell division [Pseudomonas indica]SDL05527.1 hypothetical protein SAMN05216186_11443 [Pseudomonas indica]